MAVVTVTVGVLSKSISDRLLPITFVIIPLSLSLSLQLPGDATDGLRPEQHHQIAVTDRRACAATYIPGPEGTEGRCHLNVPNEFHVLDLLFSQRRRLCLLALAMSVVSATEIVQAAWCVYCSDLHLFQCVNCSKKCLASCSTKCTLVSDHFIAFCLFSPVSTPFFLASPIIPFPSFPPSPPLPVLCSMSTQLILFTG